MCRHCERLVEDADQKQLIHDFMAATAERVNRRLAEQRYSQRVTADQIDIHVDVQIPDSATWLTYRTLAEMHK